MRSILLASVAIIAASSAQAEWAAKTDGPDVFGNTKVNAATFSDQSQGLVVQCDQKDELLLAFIFRKKSFGAVTNTNATLLVQIDGGPPAKLDARMREWNENFGGIVATGRTSDVIAVVRAIGSAKSKVNVGAEFLGNRASHGFSAQGSRKAIDAVVKGCKLENPPTQ